MRCLCDLSFYFLDHKYMLYYERDTPFDTLFYKIEKNVYLAQPEIKTKQDEKQLLSFISSRWWMKNKI